MPPDHPQAGRVLKAFAKIKEELEARYVTDVKDENAFYHPKTDSILFFDLYT